MHTAGLNTANNFIKVYFLFFSADRYRPLLIRPGGEEADYVNAVYVNVRIDFLLNLLALNIYI